MNRALWTIVVLGATTTAICFLITLVGLATSLAANFIPSAWYVREVPPNTINGKPYPAERVPEGQPQAVWWFLDQGLDGFHLEPAAGGAPQVTCTNVDGTAEIENQKVGATGSSLGVGIMRFLTMTYSGCTQTGYCAAGEAVGLEQQMPVTSSGVYITKGYAHSHDTFTYYVTCNGSWWATVHGPPLNLFWNEQGAGTHEGAEPNLPLTDSAANNARYWEPEAGLSEVNELELGELKDTFGNEMTIRGQLGYLGDDEDVYTIIHP